MTLVEAIGEPFRHPFMLRALASVVIVGALNAIVGTFVVLRGMSFYGSALAHAILPGVAVGYLLGFSGKGGLFWFALLAAAASALLIGWIRNDRRLNTDTAIGIAFSSMLALGVVLISTTDSYSIDLTHFLFGNVLAVTDASLLRTLIAAVVVLGVLRVSYRPLLLVSFDPEHARTFGVPVRRYDALLLALIAVTIVVSLQTVGIALMAALLVTPAATGYLLARRVPGVIAAGTAAALVGGIGGLLFSYHVNVASGAAIVLAISALFVVVRVAVR